MTVRGLNISSASANNIEWFTRSTLSYYLDDAPLPNIGYRIKDIARVETLLGPQGTLYGGGSLGGTIRYITNQPRLFGKPPKARMSTPASTRPSSAAACRTTPTGWFNLPIGSGSGAARVVAARLDEKGYTDRYAGTPPWLPQATNWTPKPNANKLVYEDDDYQEVNSGRAALRWRLTKDLELSAVACAAVAACSWHQWRATAAGQRQPRAAIKAPLAFNDHTVLSPYEEYRRP